MMLYRLCFDYLEILNLLSKPEGANHLNLRELRECMEESTFIQNEIAKRLGVKPERLNLILSNLNILIDFNPPLKEHKTTEMYAYYLDFSLSHEITQKFLLNKIHKVITKHGTIKDNNKWRFQ